MQKDLLETQQLAYLAIGRTNYTTGEFAKAVAAYEKLPRFSKYWDQALFENGFARFQNDDLGGALGSLQALHAPQFIGAFQPESWVLKSTVYYFACLYEESKAALKEFESLYLPMVEKLKPYVEGAPKELGTYFKLVESAESNALPKPVLLWVRSNERMLELLAGIRRTDGRGAGGAAAGGVVETSDAIGFSPTFATRGILRGRSLMARGFGGAWAA